MARLNTRASSAANNAVGRWRPLLGDPSRVKRTVTLVLNRAVAELLNERAARQHQRVDDLIRDILERAGTSRPLPVKF